MTSARKGTEMTDKERITLMLDSLADMRFRRDLINSDKQAAIDGVLTVEIKAALAGIDAEFGEQMAAADVSIGELENAVKSAVVVHGESIRGQHLMAVWSKPRVSWDAKALDGFVAAPPEMERFRKVGEPSVSIRAAQ